MEPATGRLHALDALRGAMMLLGLVLHAGASYTLRPIGDGWPYQDVRTSAAFDALLYVIHLFRMPAFFAVAGFFAALLYARDGAAGLARNRAKRVLLPLVIFWAAVGPLILGGFYFAITRGGRMTGDELLAQTAGAFRLSELSPMHLWFLWYLVIFYAATLLVVRLARGRGLQPATAARLTTSWWSLPVWGTITSLTLLPMAYAGIEASPFFLPNPKPLVAYGVFFLYGWLLYRGRDRLERLTMWWSWRSMAGMLVIVALSLVAMRTFAGDARLVHAAGCLLVGYTTWALVLAAFAVFIRGVRREHPAVRYLSDASYWMYIIHLPIVLWTAGLLARAPLHAGVKFAVVLIVTSGVSVATYHAFVRATWIGALLNGRRMAQRAATPRFAQ